MIRFKRIFKTTKKGLYLSFLGLVVFIGATPQAFSQNTTTAFTLLSAAPDSAGSVICTSSPILGAIGSSGEGNNIHQNGCQISGEITPQITGQVLTDLESSHTEFANVSCDQTLTGNLSGITLAPGAYCFEGTANLAGVLTLNGPSDGTWIFKVAGNLTATNFSMVMSGGAEKCNIWWGADSVVSTSSQLAGIFLSRGAISITEGSFHGRALAKALVTLTSVTASGCNGTAAITDLEF
jgi:hypothetical protein